MKALKWILIVVAGLFLLGVGVVVLALTSAFQTWVVGRVVANQPGMTLTIDRVGAGFSAAQVNGLNLLLDDGTHVTLDEASVTYSLFGLMSGEEVNIGAVKVAGLTIDVSNVTPAEAPPSPSTAPSAGGTITLPAGFLSQVQLPVEFRLDELAVDGRILLPEGRDGSLQISGSDLGVGREGRIDWEVVMNDPTPDSPVRTARANGAITIELSADRYLQSVQLNGTTTLAGPNLPTNPFGLRVAIGRVGTTIDERYEFEFGPMTASRIEPVVQAGIDFRAASQALAGTWEIAARSEQFSELLAAFDLPELAATGEGTFDFAIPTGDLTAEGSLAATAAQLGRVSPELDVLGTTRLDAGFDVGLSGGRATLNRLQLELADGSGRRLVEIALRQTVTYDPDSQQVMLADPASELVRLSLENLPAAWLQPWLEGMTISGGTLSTSLAVESDAQGREVRLRAVEPLQVTQISLAQEGRNLVEGATIRVSPQIDYNPDRVVAVLDGLSLIIPAGDSITGRVSATVTDPTGDPAVDFDVQFAGLLAEGFRQQFPEMPTAVRFTASASGRMQGTELQLSAYGLQVDQAEGGLLGAVEALQPFRVDLADGVYAAANPQTPAWRMRLGEIPLVWAEPFVENSALSGVFAGGTVEVSFRALDDLSVRTTQGLTLRGVSVALDGRALLEDVGLAASLDASMQGQTLTYNVSSVDVSAGTTQLFRLVTSGSATLGDELIARTTGNLSIPNVALLTRQPVLSEQVAVERGQVNLDFTASLGDQVAAELRLAVRDLLPRAVDAAPVDLDLNANVTRATDGTGAVQLPLVLTVAGRRTDVSLTGTFSQPSGGIAFNGRLAGEQVIVDDLSGLAALAGSSEETAAPASTGPAAPQTSPGGPDAEGPPWKGVSGRLDLALNRVQASGYALNNVRGALVITDNRVAVEGFEARFQDQNPVRLSGALGYAPERALPYDLTGSVGVSDLDVGAILREANPQDRPAVETRLTVNGTVAASGANLDGSLLDTATGQFDVTGGSGTLRALGRKGEAVGAVSAVVGILGALQGSSTTVASAQLASYLNEMPFDQLSLKVARGADLNLNLTQLEIRSPVMRLTGRGSISYRDNLPINQQPLAVELELAGKDQLAQLLNQAGMLAGTTDAQGYYPMSRSFQLGGTLAKPDSSALWRMVAAATASAATGLFGR